VAIVRAKARTAAEDPRDVDHLAPREVEGSDVRSHDERRSELLYRRGAFFVRDGGDEIDPRDRRPVETVAERPQRAEIGKLVEGEVHVRGEIA
jgi:hypothetical protein